MAAPFLTDTTSSARAASRPVKPLPPPPAQKPAAKPPKVTPPSAGAPSGLTGGDQALAKYLASLFGPTHTDADLQKMASGYVSGTINPQIANLTSEAKGQLSSGADALKQIYDQYATRMGAEGDKVHADTAGALQTEQGAGTALRDYLAKEGGANAAGVTAAGAGAPAGSAMANAAGAAGAGVAALGAGTAGEAAARGYTGLSELNQEGAAANEHADAMPGLARLSGEQQLGSLAGQVTGNLKTQEDQLLAQIPGMTNDLYTKLVADNHSAQQAKAQILSSFYGSTLDRNASTSIALQGLNKDLTVAQLQAMASKYGVDTRAASSAASLGERTKHDVALETQAQASYGLSVQRIHDAEAKAAAQIQNGGLTANDVARLQKDAATDLQTYYHGVAARYQTGPGGQRVIVDGTGPGSQLQYFDAIKQLMLKYPALGPKRVVAMVNTMWKPGEGGRPAKQTPWKIFGPPLPANYGKKK